jgi:hypothetical protein
MLDMVVGWNRAWGRTWSWHAFRMVCCHTVLSMQIAEVRWERYCVTVIVDGGIDVMMAYWNAWRLSYSLSYSQALCKSWRFVINEPLAL